MRRGNKLLIILMWYNYFFRISQHLTTITNHSFLKINTMQYDSVRWRHQMQRQSLNLGFSISSQPPSSLGQNMTREATCACLHQIFPVVKESVKVVLSQDFLSPKTRSRNVLDRRLNSMIHLLKEWNTSTTLVTSSEADTSIKGHVSSMANRLPETPDERLRLIIW